MAESAQSEQSDDDHDMEDSHPPSKLSNLPYPPSRFKPHEDAATSEMINQVYGPQYGISEQKPLCPRCFKSKIPSHIGDWTLCAGVCGCCGTNGHIGKLCPRLYARLRWIRLTYGIGRKGIPDDVQICPTTKQAKELAELGYSIAPHSSKLDKQNPPPELLQQWMRDDRGNMQSPMGSANVIQLPETVNVHREEKAHDRPPYKLPYLPARYTPPKNAVTIQMILAKTKGQTIGMRRNERCPRCFKGKLNHRKVWKECSERCGCCGSDGHVGSICSRIYFTPRELSTIFHVPIKYPPDYLQLRPTVEQATELAKFSHHIAPATDDVEPPKAEAAQSKESANSDHQAAPRPANVREPRSKEKYHSKTLHRRQNKLEKRRNAELQDAKLEDTELQDATFQDAQPPKAKVPDVWFQLSYHRNAKKLPYGPPPNAELQNVWREHPKLPDPGLQVEFLEREIAMLHNEVEQRIRDNEALKEENRHLQFELRGVRKD